MANLYSNNPLILDTVWTAGTIPSALKPATTATQAAPFRNMPIDAKRIVWRGATTAGHQVILQDINGNNILVGDATTGNIGTDLVLWDSTGQQNLKLKMNGWVLSTIQSGQLLIYT